MLTFERRLDTASELQPIGTRVEVGALTWRDGAMAAGVGLAVGAMLWAYHDHTWWPADEGTYAHIASRVAAGEVLNRDIQDVHFGYINLLNAAAWKAFGADLASLRYPLIASGIVAAMLVALTLRGQGRAIALTGGLATGALSIPLFINPTAHWYCLTLACVLALLLAQGAADSRAGLLLIGLSLGMMFGFRQLSAVLVAPAVVALSLSRQYEEGPRAPWGGRLLIGFAAAVFGLYMLRATDAIGFLLFALAPLILLLAAALQCRVGGGRAARIMAWIAAGAISALLPLLAYHLFHGSVRTWLVDTVVNAARFPKMPFFDTVSHGAIGFMALDTVLEGSLAERLSAAFWLIALLAPAALGMRLLIRLRRRHSFTLPALATVGAFYGAIAAHYAIPAYLTFPLALVIAGHLSLTTKGDPRSRGIAIAAVILVASVALRFHAAQPPERGLDGMIRGRRMATDTLLSARRANIYSTSPDAESLAVLLDQIERLTTPEMSILTVPWAPELYVLAERRNPFRFYNTAFGLQSEADLSATLGQMAADPPALVIHQPLDKYMTPRGQRLMTWVKERYRFLGTVENRHLYLDPARMPTPAEPPSAVQPPSLDQALSPPP